MNFAKIAANFFATSILIAILAMPILFAQNFAKVAGVKNTSPYLIVSQVDKFPNLIYSQENDVYKISFTKLGPSQAFLSILILNNPTQQTQTYNLQITAGTTKVFFGEDLDNLVTKIAVPSQASVPISIYSSDQDTSPKDRKSTRLNSSHSAKSRMPSSA